MSDLEERLMGILGNIVVNGLDVEEIGITMEGNKVCRKVQIVL